MSIELTSEMTAVVLTVEFAVGDRVREGDEVIILESMKMEIPVVTPVDGTLTELVVAEGDTVNARDVLATVTPDA